MMILIIMGLSIVVFILFSERSMQWIHRFFHNRQIKKDFKNNKQKNKELIEQFKNDKKMDKE